MPQRSHIAQVEIACSAGANWIQYRCLSKTDDELIAEITQVASICDDWGATLIITNHYHLVHQVDVQGVHIENPDADFTAIREAIGDDKTLGASATNLAALLKIQSPGVVDYCTYGPFAYTDNRPAVLPVGYGGYRQLEKTAVDIPVIAAGGIQLQDVQQLLKTGIYGIAVSSAINFAIDPAGMVKEFYRSLY
jgi:thiamine-phosphate pyrophosphorylase